MEMQQPMRVRGYLEVVIQVGTVDAIVERVQVLDSRNMRKSSELCKEVQNALRSAYSVFNGSSQ